MIQLLRYYYIKAIFLISGLCMLFNGCKQTRTTVSVTSERSPLALSANNHFLLDTGNKTFFWLGDTDWKLFHRLHRLEVKKYIETRKVHGFNVIQAVTLYELEAFKTPNAYGVFPLVGKDISRPDTTFGNNPKDSVEHDYRYHVEYIPSLAKENNMIMGLLPCWGEYVTPRFRDQTINTSLKGCNYGIFIANRFRDYLATIVSIPGGDRLPVEASNGYFDDFHVPQAAYWPVLYGACGHTYGTHPVWQMYKRENPHPPLTNTVLIEWNEAMDLPGAQQMVHLKNLILSRPFISQKPNPSLLAEITNDPVGKLVATSGNGIGKVYSAAEKNIKVNINKLSFADIKTSLYNPRDGDGSVIRADCITVYKNLIFDPPVKPGQGNDWVLVFEHVTKDFNVPEKLL